MENNHNAGGDVLTEDKLVTNKKIDIQESELICIKQLEKTNKKYLKDFGNLSLEEQSAENLTLKDVSQFVEQLQQNNPPQKMLGSSRMSRSIRGWKKPLPQPHICVLDKTVDDKDVFINVLSWSKISKPKDPKDPIPLFGGNRVYSTNAVYRELYIYVVTAHPEVLKKTRRCDTPCITEEQYSLMMLMSDFVGAMNPGLCLKKQPVLLDRDLTGELKEIWQAIQLNREREKFSAISKNSIFYEEFGPTSMNLDLSVQSFTNIGCDDTIENGISSSDVEISTNTSQNNLNNSNNNNNINNNSNHNVEEKEKLVEDVDLNLESNETKLIENENNKEKEDSSTEIQQTESIKSSNDDEKINEKDVLDSKTNTITNEAISPTNEKTQQSESFKKRLEIITNGCQNFFLFKSKNSQNSNNSSKKKDKESKEINKDSNNVVGSPTTTKSSKVIKIKKVDEINLKNEKSAQGSIKKE